MIDLTTTNEWQYRDPEMGLVFPWYTKPALDEIVKWELSDKKVLEIGGGASTLWWNAKAKYVVTLETSKDYFSQLNKSSISITHTETLVDLLFWVRDAIEKPDIIIIDCEPVRWRDSCIPSTIKYLKPGGKLIIDNWLQPSVGWMPSEESQQLLSKYPVELFKQPNHPDWQTAIFTIQ